MKKSIFVIVLLLILSTNIICVFAKETLLHDKVGLTFLKSDKYGGFYELFISFTTLDGYEVTYYADGFLKEKKNERPYDFVFKNPLNKNTLEPVEHKFVIRDLSTGEVLDKSVTLGIFDKEHNTFVPEYKGVDFNTLSGRFYRARTDGDSMPPSVGYIKWANWKKPSELELKATDDEGIKSIELLVDGKKYSSTDKKEKAFISGESYFLKLPKDNKEHSYKILITDTSGNSTERTYDPKTRVWE